MVEGQKNPYYCVMVEMLDHYVGKLFRYLEQTDDPRWPGHKLIENTYIIFTSDNVAKVVRANLLYTKNGGDRYEEWFRAPAELLPGGKVAADLPEGTTHYVINLIDENNFIVSYPEMPDGVEQRRRKFSQVALSVKGV